MPLLQAKWHKIQSLWLFWNGNVPVAPLQMRRICWLLFLEIPLRLDEPVSIAETCIFHQVIETQLQRINYLRGTEYSNKFIVYCVRLSPFCSNVVGSLTNQFWVRYFFPKFSNILLIFIHLLFWVWYLVSINHHHFLSQSSSPLNLTSLYIQWMNSLSNIVYYIQTMSTQSSKQCPNCKRWFTTQKLFKHHIRHCRRTNCEER